MASIGYTLMTEQTGPRDLITHAQKAEKAGFAFAVSSDHYFPWLVEMGHSPNAWVTLGAVAQATETLPLMTYVTCPTFRYHPAVVAQQAATLQIISDGRFTLGLGAGENLNEHVTAGAWPGANIRQAKLIEAIDIISALFDGGYVNHHEEHFTVDSAKLWDLPDVRVPIAVAVSGHQSCTKFAPLADAMIGIDPEAQLTAWWDEASGRKGSDRKIAQLPISWDSDAEAAKERAHRLFRWSAGGWKVNAELPSPTAFDSASQAVTPDLVAESIPCGNDISAVVDAAKKFFDAGYTDLALVQVGADQQDTFFAASAELLAELNRL